MKCDPDGPEGVWTMDDCYICGKRIGCDPYMGAGPGRKKHMDCEDNTLKAVAGEGGLYMMVDETNQRTYKPGQLTDTGEREAGDVLIAVDAAGNRYRWTMETWTRWNDQLSDAMKRAEV